MASLQVGMIGAFDPEYPRNHIIRVGLQRVGVDVISECLPMRGSNWLLIPKLFAAFRRLAHCDFILIAAQNQQVALFVWLLGKVFGKPILLDYFLGLTDVSEDRRRITGFRAYLHWWIDYFNTSIVPSITDTTAHRDAFRRLLGGNLDKMANVVPVGIQDDFFRPLPLPAKNGEVTVQFYGNFIPFHGIDVIVKAIALLRYATHVQFEIIGRGQTYAEIIRLANDLDLKNVLFMRPMALTNLVERLSHGAIILGVFGPVEKTDYVVPNKVFQGMALGRPVITAESAALNEYFTSGEHYLGVPPGDPEALAAAIRNLVDSPGERERLGKAGAARIREAFLPEHIGAQLKEIIEDMVKSRRKTFGR